MWNHTTDNQIQEKIRSYLAGVKDLDTASRKLDGKTTPLRPCKILPAVQTQDAFRNMQKGQHIGRVGISIQHAETDATIPFQTTKKARAVEFNPSAASDGPSLSGWLSTARAS